MSMYPYSNLILFYLTINTHVMQQCTWLGTIFLSFMMEVPPLCRVVLPPPIPLELSVWIGLPVLKYLTKYFQNWVKCWSYMWGWTAICFISANLIILSQYFVELWDFRLLAHKSLESMTPNCVWSTINQGKFKLISILCFFYVDQYHTCEKK